jgi:MscS family membrane protein
MKTFRRVQGLTGATVRTAAWLLLALALARSSAAQLPSAVPQAPTATPRTEAEDPLRRSTPYGAVTGFLRAVQRDDYALAVEYLDTRKTGAEAEELARQLKSVLDRGLKTDLDRLSKAPEGDLQDGLANGRDRVGVATLPTGDVDILVDRIDRPDGQPIWKFAASTLAEVPAAAEALGPLGPGRYLPRVLLEVRFLSVPLYHWLGVLVFLAMAIGLGTVVTRLLVPLLRLPLRKLTGEEDDRTLVSLRAPIRLLLTAVAVRVFSLLAMSLIERQFWTRVAATIAIIGVAWLLIRFTDIATALLEQRVRRRQRSGRIAILALGRRLFDTLVVVVAALWLLHRADVNLTAVLTGLGIGGIGLALAAQKTLENLFGGVTLIVDEPIRVGDFCRIADVTGTVEDIGVRSTRVRTLDRTVVAVPNGQLASMNIENFSLRDKFWLRHMIGVRYETSAEQLRYVLAEVRGLLLGHPKVEPADARIRFVGFGGSSLDLEVFAYVRAVEMPDFLRIQEDLLLRIMDIIAQAGTSIAFPSQTTYLVRDTALDSQKTEQAVAQVRQWRDKGELPFPDFSPEHAERLRDQVDYPPHGSASPGRS